MMASDAATGLDIAEGNFLPTKWSDWIALPVRGCDQSVKTSHGLFASRRSSSPPTTPRFLSGVRDSAPAAFGSEMAASARTGARWRRLPVHWPQALTQGGQHRSRGPAFPRRQNLVGQLRARPPGSEFAEGRSASPRGRFAPASTPERSAGDAGVCAYPEQPRRCRLGALPWLSRRGPSRAAVCRWDPDPRRSRIRYLPAGPGSNPSISSSSPDRSGPLGSFEIRSRMRVKALWILARSAASRR